MIIQGLPSSDRKSMDGQYNLAKQNTSCPRAEIVKAIKARRRRIGQYPKEPTKWHPEQIMNPGTGMSFTDTSAWNFIADNLSDEKTTVSFLKLNHPPGDSSWVMVLSLRDNSFEVYIKIAFKNGIVIGRSFHPSNLGQSK